MQLVGHVLQIGIIQQIQVLVIGLHRALLEAFAGCAPLSTRSLQFACLIEEFCDIWLAFFQVLSTAQGLRDRTGSNEFLGALTLGATLGGAAVEESVGVVA